MCAASVCDADVVIQIVKKIVVVHPQYKFQRRIFDDLHYFSDKFLRGSSVNFFLCSEQGVFQ